MLKILSFILIFILATPSHAAPLAETFTLSNGLQVVAIPNHKIPAVAHMVWYKVGAIDEPPGQSGIAHFLEHLMFKETENLSEGDFSALIASSGGNDNAFTMHDATAYFQTITKEHLPLVMALEAERMTNLLFDEDTVTKERDIVIEERSMRTDNNPRNQLIEQMKAALYRNHPYGRPIIGWEHEIRQYSLAQTKAFYNAHYAPNNAFLIVAGDITAAELKLLAEKYYGPISQKKTSKRLLLEEPPQRSARTVSLQDVRVQKPEWIRYYASPSANSGKTQYAIALSLLSQILGGSDTSRLYRSLVSKQKLAAEVATYYDEIALGPTAFGLYITPAPNADFQQIEEAAEKEIIRLLEQGIADDELQTAKNILKASVTYARDGFKKLGFIYGQVLTAGLDVEYVEQWPDLVSAVTEEDILAAAKYIFTPEKSVTGTLTTVGMDNFLHSPNSR